MGNNCTSDNLMCSYNKRMHQQKVSLLLAQQIFEKELNLQEEVKDIKKAEELVKVIQKIISYQNLNLIQHLTNQKNKSIILKFLQTWSRLKLQQVDMMHQNLIIRNHHESIQSKIVFSNPKLIKKSNKQKIPEIFNHYVKKGRQMHKEGKICFILFTPDLDDQKQHHSTIKTLEKTLVQISNYPNLNQGMIPFTVVVTSVQMYMKVKQSVKKILINISNYAISVKRSNFIMDELGGLCLRASNSPELIQKSLGNDEFLTLPFEGEPLANVLKNKNIQFVIAIQLQHFDGKPIDYFMWGYFFQNIQSFDVIYRCSQIFANDSIHMTVKQKSGKIHLVKDQISQSRKGVLDWKNLIGQSVQVKWQGYFIFDLKAHTKIRQMASEIQIRQVVQIKREKICYWNPETKSYQMNKECTYFYKPLSNFFLRLEPNRACGIEYVAKFQDQKLRKKPSNFDAQFF